MLLIYYTDVRKAREKQEGLVYTEIMPGKEIIMNKAVKAGENFRFEKGGLHSVKADGKFKMALLLTLR